jgi:tRNA uridine 5-carboxymethylaminomethyl modification enzyme
MFHVKDPQVIVVGGGHAGVEAALASARLGVPTLLVTMSVGGIGRMPCNPAVGGQAKGHLVREIDALGGQMALATDATTIQFKYLNTRKGLAVRSSRAQVDRFGYQHTMERAVRGQPGLALLEGEVARVQHTGGRVSGVELADGTVIPCRAVVLTTGTALRGQLHTGMYAREGGGGGSPSARTLSSSLAALGHRLARLKTGTVPRLDGRSIDWDRVPAQEGDHPGGRFSFVGPASALPQVRCHVATSNERTHEALRRGLPHSPMYGEQACIEGVGPRYCPSIEDKIVRFPDRTAHRLFLEPEGLASREVYINGFSTSLPVGTQLAALHTIEGLERVRVVRPGYAIEYDFADPRDLDRSLQSRHLPGLWLAGQVNGTTGYEEAAGQGLLAGIAAARQVLGEEPLLLARDEAYLGVMVHDLTTLGTEEPYRMFTSRAEWRLLLREDNADLRLTPRGRAVGLVDDARFEAFEARREAIARGLSWARGTAVRPGPRVQALLETRTGAPLARTTPIGDLIRRPELDLEELAAAAELELPELGPEELEQVVIQCRYAGYLDRQQAEVHKLRDLAGLVLPPGIDYATLPGLRYELVEKLSRHRPATLDEAARIPGVTPAALALLAARARTGGTP